MPFARLQDRRDRLRPGCRPCSPRRSHRRRRPPRLVRGGAFLLAISTIS